MISVNSNMPNIKLYIYGAIAVFLITAGLGAWWYYTWSQNEINTLKTNNAKLEIAVTTQKETINSLTADALNAKKTVLVVNKEFRVARAENNVLRAKLAKHDLGFLAEKKPRLIKKIVNKGTKDVGRCFEILSGAELTEKEKNATKKSQINSSCPDIANPLYRPKS